MTFGATGFAPGEAVEVTLFSTPRALGTVTADTSGNASITFEVLASDGAGEHRVEFSGPSGTFSVPFTLVLPGRQRPTSVAARHSLTQFRSADRQWPQGFGPGAIRLLHVAPRPHGGTRQNGRHRALADTHHRRRDAAPTRRYGATGRVPSTLPPAAAKAPGLERRPHRTALPNESLFVCQAVFRMVGGDAFGVGGRRRVVVGRIVVAGSGVA